MGKTRARKKNNKNQLLDEKRNKLEKFWQTFSAMCEEFEIRLKEECSATCTKISKLYADKLKSLPENYRNMTLTEYLVAQQQDAQVLPEIYQELKLPSTIRSQYEKSKFDSEKKKTAKKSRTERKRSLSVSICSSKKGVPPSLPRLSRVMSESCLTPQNKQSIAPAFVVTPKFNPRIPIGRNMKRKPRAGEVVLSMSGSPLQNFVDDIAQRPSVAVSLGGGSFFKITEDTEVAKLENEYFKKLDEETKSTLTKLQKKLNTLLES